MIKPIDQTRLQQAFQKLIDFMTCKHDTVTQNELDIYFGQSNDSSPTSNVSQKEDTLPKGIDDLTLDKIKSFLINYEESEITAQMLGEAIGISRSTARSEERRVGKECRTQWEADENRH